MKRTQKGDGPGMGAQGFVLALGLSGLLAFSGLGYVWHRNRNVELGREIRAERVRLVELRGRLAELERQQARLESIPELQARVRELGLGLVMPLPEQILRLPEWPGGTGEGGPLRLAAQPMTR
ncbi:MAG: hypothetical protein FJ387_21345 [Verrucomicrobia bacterium]|nr:hypothetical protein [Verrucomicrobiota bacterium]